MISSEHIPWSPNFPPAFLFGCESGLFSCATWAAKAEERDKHDAQIQRHVMEGMDKMLKQLWR